MLLKYLRRAQITYLYEYNFIIVLYKFIKKTLKNRQSIRLYSKYKK